VKKRTAQDEIKRKEMGGYTAGVTLVIFIETNKGRYFFRIFSQQSGAHLDLDTNSHPSSDTKPPLGLHPCLLAEQPK
jgi:hypothetical protein